MSKLDTKRGLFVTVEGYGHLYTHSLFWPILCSISEIFPIEWDVLQIAPKDHPEIPELLSIIGSEKVILMSYPQGNIEKFISILRGILKKTFYSEVVISRSHVLHLYFLREFFISKPRNFLWIWDMDGFMPEERVEFGGWKRYGPQYRILKMMEKQLLFSADAVVVRTWMAKDILVRWYGNKVSEKIFVVPNGKPANVIYFPDGETALWMGKFIETRRLLGFSPNDILIVYSGSIGPQYLPEYMFSLIERLRSYFKNIKFLILVNHPERAKDILPLTLRDISYVRRVPYSFLSQILWVSDFGLSLRMDTLSQSGVFPVKNVEYLLAGIPIISNYPMFKAMGLLPWKHRLHTDLFYHEYNPYQPDIERLISWMQRALQNRDRVRHAARYFAMRFLSDQAIAKKYIQALQYALSKRKSP